MSLPLSGGCLLCASATAAVESADVFAADPFTTSSALFSCTVSRVDLPLGPRDGALSGCKSPLDATGFIGEVGAEFGGVAAFWTWITGVSVFLGCASGTERLDFGPSGAGEGDLIRGEAVVAGVLSPEVAALVLGCLATPSD